MRKRNIYKQAANPKSKIPTIIIMCVVLFCILYFGHTISDRVARMVVPEEPTIDQAADQKNSDKHEPVAQTGSADQSEPSLNPHNNPSPSPGTVLYNTNQAASRSLLDIVANP